MLNGILVVTVVLSFIAFILYNIYYVRIAYAQSIYVGIKCL